MANIKSKIKRMKQSRVAALRNKETKTLIKSTVRKFKEAVAAKDAKNAQAVGSKAIRILDKAVSKGIIHKNRAAEKKSFISSTLHNLQGKGSPKKETTPATKKTSTSTTKKTASKS